MRTIKQLTLIGLLVTVFFSCKEKTNKKNTTLEDTVTQGVFIAEAAQSNIIANATIIETGTGWKWDSGQVECTMYAKINSVLKGNVKTGDTIAFTITKLKNEKQGDPIYLKKNINYIVFLLATNGTIQYGTQKDDSTQTEKTASTESTTQKSVPLYKLTDQTLGVVNYDSSTETQLKEIIKK